MSSTTLELPAGLQNTLSVPREMRNYIHEQGEGRSFNIESVSIHQTHEPRKIVIELHIGATGAEQLDPFIVNLELGEMAAGQLVQALSADLQKSAAGEAGAPSLLQKDRRC